MSDDACIVIHDETFIHTVWWGGFAGGDFLGALLRDGKGPWEITYRFRYHADQKIHDSADRKSSYRFRVPDDRSADEIATWFSDTLTDKQHVARGDIAAHDVHRKGAQAARAVQGILGDNGFLRGRA